MESCVGAFPEQYRARRGHGLRPCWAKLVDPRQVPAYPDFWYSDPPREAKPGTWGVGKCQLGTEPRSVESRRSRVGTLTTGG